MNRRLARLLLISVLAGCGNQPRGIRIDVKTGASCTATPSGYNIECVSAFEARLLDENLEVLETNCAEVSAGVFESANDLYTVTEVVPVLENIQPREAIYIELRGYHDLVVSEQCQQETPSRDDLMFWGRSALLDMTDDSLEVIDIDIECRDACDCGAIDNDAACPLALTESVRVCTPPLLCRSSCGSSADCWDDEVSCQAEHCAPKLEEGMCFACDSNLDCTDGLACVSHTTGELTERFCARLCASDTELVACPDTMGCLLPDGEDLVLLP